jgi:hypothetical protein
MSFRNLVCEHLAQYKVDDLKIQEDGLFPYHGRNIPKAHILPKAHYKLNVLERYRDRFFFSHYANLKFHQFFHHLNSSQALCINLFYPLIAESALGLFLEFLQIEPGIDLHAFFEKKSNLETAVRPTSFDFHIQHAMVNNIFVEVKYTESGFSRAKNDNEHSSKFRKTYLPLVKNSLFLTNTCQEEAFFLSHYQILRNFVHISETDYVVLLFPSANISVTKEASYSHNQLLTDAGRARLKIVFLDEFILFLEKQCANRPLNGYYQTFRTKYLPRENGYNKMLR